MKKYENYSKAILTENLSDILNRAKAGDTLAARQALETIIFLMSDRNAHSKTGKRWPVPDFVRDYIASALRRIASGIDANEALGLSVRNRPTKNNHLDLRRAAFVMWQIIEQNPKMMRKEAAEYAASVFNKSEKSKSEEYKRLGLIHTPVKLTKTAIADWYRYNERELEVLLQIRKRRV